MASGALRGMGAFRRVTRGGLRWDAGLLRCYVRVERDVPASFRVGISVSARDYTAVQRNRLRRLLREGMRRERPSVCAALRSVPARAELVLQVRGIIDPGRVRLQDVQAPVTEVCKRLVRMAASEIP